jgi:hypothetical protein
MSGLATAYALLNLGLGLAGIIAVARRAAYEYEGAGRRRPVQLTIQVVCFLIGLGPFAWTYYMLRVRPALESSGTRPMEFPLPPPPGGWQVPHRDAGSAGSYPAGPQAVKRAAGGSVTPPPAAYTPPPAPSQPQERTCTACGGRGKIPCALCGDRGMVPASLVGQPGNAMVPCHACGASGPGGRQCTACGGSGKVR